MSGVSVVIELQGHLVENAHMAQKQLDCDGHYVPALCFEIKAEVTGSRCKVEQYFPAGHDKQCQQAAWRLKRGALVSFQVSSECMAYRASGVSHVHVISTPEPAAPAQVEIAA